VLGRRGPRAGQDSTRQPEVTVMPADDRTRGPSDSAGHTAVTPATAGSGDVPQRNPVTPPVTWPQPTRVSLDELRQHWQHDVDQWHHETARLRIRARVAVGIALAIALCGVAAVWFAALHRAGTPACPPPPTSSSTGGGVQ
jgi:hypothetical protein